MKERGEYLTYVEALIPQFPQFNILLARSRLCNKFSLTTVHVDTRHASPIPEIRNYSSYSQAENVLDYPDHGHTFLIVEDLSRQVIEHLGKAYDIPPFFFADHLRNSSYLDDDESKSDPQTELDPVTGLPFTFSSFDYSGRSHFTLRWQRLVAEYSHKVTEPKERDPSANIIRQPQDLQVFVCSKGASEVLEKEEGTFVSHKLSAVSEHISVFRSTSPQNGASVFVVLCDPSPHLTNPLIAAEPPSGGEPRTSINLQITKPVSFRSFAENRHIPQYHETSTSKRLVQMLESGGKYSPAALLETVYTLILGDWGEVLAERVPFLRRLDEEKVDDKLIQNSITTWRRMLGFWSRDLSDNAGMITAALTIMRTQNKLRGILVSDSERLEADLPEQSFVRLEIMVDGLKKRAESIMTSLMTSLSIMESQRAISQAERISRLTELAFFFIPTTFVASLYGANISNFQNNLTLSNWAYVTAALLAMTYGLRMATHYYTKLQKGPRRLHRPKMSMKDTWAKLPPMPSMPSIPKKVLWSVALVIVVLAVSIPPAVVVSLRNKSENPPSTSTTTGPTGTPSSSQPITTTFFVVTTETITSIGPSTTVTSELTTSFLTTSTILPGSTTSTPSSTPTDTPPIESGSPVPVGAIVGGAVGGVASIVLALMLGIFLLRRRRKSFAAEVPPPSLDPGRVYSNYGGLMASAYKPYSPSPVDYSLPQKYPYSPMAYSPMEVPGF
ncbi:hypothetical protein ABW19_dt0206873 [Dactylella cylindrospora]|nr:hypothetical protein ABW19_dt0206873 [Dactylella cylindrospora]